MDVIANQVSPCPRRAILRSYAGSYNSLNMLYHGHVDIATSHLWDEQSQSYNLPYISKLLPGLRVMVVPALRPDHRHLYRQGQPARHRLHRGPAPAGSAHGQP